MNIPFLSLARSWTSGVRRLLLITSLAFGLAAPASHGAEIGVNFNGLLTNIDQADLARAQTAWIRGFVDYYQFRSGQKNVMTDPGLDALHDAHVAGYKTIINIKFNFTSKDFPTTTAAINTELNYINTLLTVLYPDCDIIVIGNEPFIESIPAQRDSRLVNFYTAAAAKVKAFKDAQTRKIPLYIGAFNRLWDPAWQTQATADLLQYANTSTWLTGIDLHIHHTNPPEIDGAFAYASARIRTGQKILVTEYSLVHHWKANLTQTIPAQLASQYGRPAAWQVWQYLDYALDNPVSRPEWVTFLQNSPWFENRKHYLLNSYNQFTANPKFLICTYAMYQSSPATFTSTTDPWILNPIFVNQTVVPNPSNGQTQINYSFFDDFVSLQP